MKNPISYATVCNVFADMGIPVRHEKTIDTPRFNVWFFEFRKSANNKIKKRR